MFSRRSWLSAVCALPLALIGCQKSEAPAPQVTPEAAKAEAAVSPAKAEAKPEAPAPTKGKPLAIAYSDWPGWVAWEIGIQKGWFKEAGVEVDFKWFEYVPSMEAFSAGKVDAVTMTNGDALVTGSSGAPSVAILINDYSNGNDMVVAKPGINKPADLKGKKVGVEVGFVSHLLLLNALKAGGLTEKDIKIVNVPTDQTPQTLKSGSVDAIVAWQPNSGAALKEVPSAKAVFTSANVPGLIYDVLSVSPKSLTERREDWKKVVGVWMRIADFVTDPKNADEAAKIMSARVGLKPEEYKPLMKGTFFLNLAGNQKHFAKGDTLESIYNSTEVVNKFQVENKVYKQAAVIEPYLDRSLVDELAKK
ncbi:MAG: ABC transporter substrate-binding protein [Polyangiaceae bacterium]|nr:ABC transporter substrate-binding protein [Polyangiaceae bacterium]